jgi:hypothetical protein
VIRRDPNASVYAQTATIWHPQDGVAAWTTSVEVMALRTNLRVGWEKQPSRKGSIVCRVDGSWVTNDLVAQLEREFPDDDVDVITPTTPFVDAVETLLGARAFVFKSSESAWNLLWALPLRAKVIDLQFEMSPSLEGIHMAKVCGLSHHLIIKARDTVPSSQDVSDYTKKVIGVLALTPSTPPAQVPTLFMPAADTKGFFAHSGDSFRELARLWEARGHVHIVYQDGLSNIWLGAVGSGGTLLYDRPTVEWLNRSAPHEREWSRALFGNPDAKGQNAVPWTFWPRRPELVEDMVTGGLHEAGYANRGRRIVFYGRSENAVQAERRAADWGSVFGSNDEFVHVKGLNPYPYSQREYLERIANARFGLCLAGYGKKCHREIECMALGCVPVVAPEVDMESYAVPPVEGTHYLRCRVPGDLDTLLSSVDEGAWAKMSAAGHAWWLANASVEGSWNLTKRLAGLL